MRQVALLRGINLGGHRRIDMAPLRELMHDLGYGRVRTHLRSGNVVFTGESAPERSARIIQAGIAERFGGTVPVLVRDRADLARVVEDNPLREIAIDPSRFLVMFLSAPPDSERLSTVRQEDVEPEVFRIGTREIYLWCPNGLRASKLTTTRWEKLLARTATARNWNTVTKLLALADS